MMERGDLEPDFVFVSNSIGPSQRVISVKVCVCVYTEKIPEEF